MPLNFETTIPSRMLNRIWTPLALLALAAAACAGLAGCGGGGSGGGAQVMITPSPSQDSPDLVVASPSVSDPAPAAGVDFTLSATVRNDGDGAASAVTLRFYRSDDAAITPSDVQVGAASASGLAASGSAAASVSLSAPSSSGTYYYGACADVVAGESEAANNCSTAVRITVSAPEPRFPAPAPQVLPPGPRASPQPDLVVESPSVSDANPLPGAGFTLSARVRNAGDERAAASALRFYRSLNRTIEKSDTQVGGASVAELAASGSVVGSVELNAPPDFGTYHYGACVDEVDGESDTANNCSSAVRVKVSGPPDLVALQPTFRSTNPFVGTHFRIIAKARNVGGRRAERTTLRIYRSDDATITTSDTQVDSYRTSPVQPSGRPSVETSLRAPWTSGTYYYGVCVDVVAGESDTSNNCSPSVEITVREAPPPDLVLGSPRVSPASPAAGGVFNLYVNVRNAGGKGVGKTTLRFYRSDDATITTSDTQLGSLSITNVQPWESFEEGIGRLDTPAIGSYYYGACLDAVSEESDATNNCSAALTLQVTHAKPNLKFLGWSVGEPKGGDGSSFFLSVTVQNVGGPAAATTLRFYRSSDATITSSDTQLASVSVPALAKTEPRETPKFLSKRVHMTAPSAPGTYYYGACIDDVPGESDTTDNCRVIHWLTR